MINGNYKDMLTKKSVIREAFQFGAQRAKQIGRDNVFDYSLGNPSVPCPTEFTGEVMRLLKNEKPMDLHGYCPSQGDPGFRAAVAENLAERFGLPYQNIHIFPTTGAAGALSHAIRAVSKPGDEIITFAPFFPEYTPYVEGAGARLTVLPAEEPSFQPNLTALQTALNPSVAAVLINTPNNPSGVVYSKAALQSLASILAAKSAEYGHTIYLISDEPYREILFKGVEATYPAAVYPHTLTCYSFSKSLSLPGERIGYVAVAPSCEGADILVDVMAQISRFIGHNCPPSLIQKACVYCLDITSDVSVYETNMRLLYDELLSLGYDVQQPDGTFYMFVKALEDDAVAFCERARAFDLMLVPSDSFGVEGYFRIAYCIETEKVLASLPAFAMLAELYGK